MLGDPLELKMFEASGWNYEADKSRFRPPLEAALQRADGHLSSDLEQLLDSVLVVLTPKPRITAQSQSLLSSHSTSIQMVRFHCPKPFHILMYCTCIDIEIKFIYSYTIVCRSRLIAPVRERSLPTSSYSVRVQERDRDH